MGRRIGVFGGTFNPVHQGHLDLAQWLIDRKVVSEVMLTLSPANPLKNDRPGATDTDRRTMLSLACEGIDGLTPCFVEFTMPRPSYSIATLRRIAAEHPDASICLIIGADNWLIFDKWRSWREIIEEFGVIVYPRPGYSVSDPLPEGVTYLADAPMCDVSSTEIRNAATQSSPLLPATVAAYIKAHNLYEPAR